MKNETWEKSNNDNEKLYLDFFDLEKNIFYLKLSQFPTDSVILKTKSR